MNNDSSGESEYRMNHNQINAIKQATRGVSKYRGVYWHKPRRRWRATIGVNGKRKHLGWFDNEETAAKAYNHAARIHHGNHAVLNFPEVKHD